MGFTEMIPDPRARNIIGVSSVVFIIACVTLNITIVAYVNINIVKLWCKRKLNHRRHKNTNRKILLNKR